MCLPTARFFPKRKFVHLFERYKFWIFTRHGLLPKNGESRSLAIFSTAFGTSLTFQLRTFYSNLTSVIFLALFYIFLGAHGQGSWSLYFSGKQSESNWDHLSKFGITSYFLTKSGLLFTKYKHFLKSLNDVFENWNVRWASILIDWMQN